MAQFDSLENHAETIENEGHVATEQVEETVDLQDEEADEEGTDEEEVVEPSEEEEEEEKEA